MARKGDLRFVPKTTVAGDLISLDLIPTEVAEEVEEIYTTLAGSDGRIRVEYDTEAELKRFEHQVKSYCAQRPGGAVKFRRSPTRNLPKNVMDFRITDKTDEEETKEVSNGVALKAVAKVQPPAKTTGRK